MTFFRHHIVPVAALLLTVSAATAVIDQANAAEPADTSMNWLDDDYPYLAVDQALPDALRELGHNLDITVDISPKIKGRVRHYEHDGTAREFLDYLVSEHRLDWVVDHGRLFLSSVGEQRVRAWQSDVGTYERVKAALADANIDDPRFPIGFNAGRGEISLSAPPRYVAAASPIIERLLAPKATRTVKVIHGRSRKGGT